MSHHVDDDGYRQQEDVILARLDLYAVAVTNTEPLLGHLGDLISTFTDFVLMVQDVALNLQVRAISYLHHPAVTQRRDQGFLNHRQPFT
ncbi:MAG TPA: hypothetical protein P5526_21850, partial [Anaerolineae bacterium]|nr:hypothetical protein [Anaerolineae bacterium]